MHAHRSLGEWAVIMQEEYETTIITCAKPNYISELKIVDTAQEQGHQT